MRRTVAVCVVALGGLLAVAASQQPAKPLMTAGTRYVILTAGTDGTEKKRTVDVVEVLPGGWVRAKYTSSTDMVERVITLNMAHVLYFHSEPKQD